MKIIPNQTLTLNEIAKATGADYTGPDTPLRAIVTDSREADKEDLFVALSGDTHNGEDFVRDAAQSGAFILSKEAKNAEIKVADTEGALLDIASYYKKKLRKLKYTIAITGSVGKTTTKNLISEVLRNNFSVHSTYGNYNNYLGVSHTVLTAQNECEILVIELGMNHIGEISRLSKAISPDISVITNVGTAHIGNLGNREAIARAKTEIKDGMKKPFIILPEEEALLKQVKGRYSFSVFADSADCHLKNVLDDELGATFDVHTKSQIIRDVRINVPGNHILSSVAITAAIIDLMGLDLGLLKEALPKIKAENVVRAKILKCGKYRIYDDTYSASYEATLANLELLAKKEKNLCCVLGDMLELGEKSKLLHEKVGAETVKYGIRKLFTFGKAATDIANGAQKAGMDTSCIFINENVNDPRATAEQIKKNCNGDELLLFKASHAIHAERILEHIT